ncbi:hypothetical protein M758_4G132900 [Ceratodon purpureus]|nr:hypothetical protein M758_4G132900 [Ceratodon purpureus]
MSAVPSCRRRNCNKVADHAVCDIIAQLKEAHENQGLIKPTKSRNAAQAVSFYNCKSRAFFVQIGQVADICFMNKLSSTLGRCGRCPILLALLVEHATLRTTTWSLLSRPV